MYLTEEQMEMMCELLSAVPGITAMMDLMKNEELASILINPELASSDNMGEFQVTIRLSKPLMLSLLKSVDTSVNAAKEIFHTPEISDRFKNESALPGVLGHILLMGLKDMFLNSQKYKKEALATINNYYKKLGLDKLIQ